MFHDLSKSILTPSVRRRFWAKVQQGAPDECWPWLGSQTPYGHGRLNVCDDGQHRVEYAHRIAFMLAHDCDIPARMVIMHACDNAPCCNPQHLSMGTFSENAQDRENKGRHPLHRPLVPQRLPEMVRRYQDGASLPRLAREYHADTRTIRKWLNAAGVKIRKPGGQPGPRHHTKHGA